MNTYEPGCSSFQTPEAISCSQVPVPAPVTIGHAIPDRSTASRDSAASAAAFAIASRRSSGVRRCCAAPW